MFQILQLPNIILWQRSPFLKMMYIYNVLDNLDPTKATGHEGIGPRMLRNCADYINLFITCLPRAYNIVTYPQNGQLILLFLYSNGERNLIINYRPISLLSNISKLLERLIYDKIIAFVSDNISSLQFGALREDLLSNSY